MTRNEKANHIPKFFIVSLLLLFSVIVIFVFLFMERNRNRIIDQNQRYLESAASQSVKYMNEVLDNAAVNIRMVSRLYELQIEEPVFDYHLLNEITESTSFNSIRFVSPEGVSWSAEGMTVDCADREYYQEGIRGRSGVCFIDASRFNSQKMLIFYTPLYYEGEIIGVVNGVLHTEQLISHLENSLFGRKADSCISMPDGTIIASSWSAGGLLDAEDQISVFSTDAIKQSEKERVARAMREGRPVSFQYTGALGVGNAYSAPLTSGKFVLTQTFPSAASHDITENANRDTLRFEVAILIVFAIYLAMLALYYTKRSRKLFREKEDLGQIVDSVKQLYRRFVVIDLDADTYEYLNAGDLSNIGLPPQGTYTDWFVSFRRRYEANPNFWGSMEDMTVKHLKQTLTKEHWYAHREYPVPGGRFERLSLIRLDTDDGPASRILGAVEDITEVKQQEEERRMALESAFRTAESANRAKSDFLSRMSHDIRTPMNAIVGLAAIMGTHLDDKDRIVDCLTKITSSSKHLLGLINEVLDMSKIESGKLVLSEAEFGLSALVDDMLSIIQPMINAKHQELTVHIQDVSHEDVLGDSLRLQQVLVNILTNAVKYTEENGHISIKVTEKPSRTPQLGEYEFVVQDDGIGMSPEFLEKIYTPFERAEDERTSKTQGTGLGMSIAHSIVQLMGGTISAESELGKGSCFTVTVFLKLQEQDNSALEHLVGLPVLVADDDQIACETTCVLLDELGMCGEWVLTGREAVDRVKQHHVEKEDYYAVILDWKMPEMDGLETAKAIRREVGPDVPIIILSAYDWSEIEAEARDAGVDAFIAKPLFKSRLRGVFTSLRTGAASDVTDPLGVMRSRDFSGKRILLVEDNDLNQEIAKEILEMVGLTVDVAENGKVAVDQFDASPENTYDLIFMDIQMPIMNGYDATREIRALLRGDAAQVPIIAMTANTFSEDVRAAIDAGMNQHIGKPLVMDQLVAVLDKWLG